jgi:hypothetical protein
MRRRTLLAGIIMGCAGVALGHETDVCVAWNKLVDSLDKENPMLKELQDSYQRFRPGAVALPPEVRASQRERRVKLIDDVTELTSHRVPTLGHLKRAETSY